jgi:uncharacterized protein YebE (UPF0316 family)
LARGTRLGVVDAGRVMIAGFLLISALMAVTYAVNAWKIRMVTDGRAMCAAALEGLQGLLFIIAIARIVDLTDSTMGAFAYVVGAFVGTATAVLFQGRHRNAGNCSCVNGALSASSDPPAPRDFPSSPRGTT